MSEGLKRVFLGWEGSALDRAAEWILRERGEDLEKVLVALPGSRAARALREKLARLAKPSWSPPEILTQGALIDALVETDRPVAGRLARTLAWARALADLPRERIEVLAARPPEKGDLRGALALAETVRALHAELAEQGLGFDRLREEPRFDVLAEAQRRWRAILDGLGLADPHESRFAAIDAGKLARGRDVILVGVADMNGLLRHLLAKLGGRATALVVAPASEAEAFDELGCVRSGAWNDRDLAIPLDRWRVVDGPDAQAETAVSILAALDARFAPEEVSIGLCDEEVGPYLERRLGDEGVVARHAAGTPIETTRAFRLLAHLSAWLARRAFASYAELLRHPDLEAALVRTGGIDLPRALDAYHALHLPESADGTWLEEQSAVVRAADARLRTLLAGVDGPHGNDRPLAEWPAAIRGFLANVYEHDLEATDEKDRVLAASLSLLSDALEEIERLPSSLGSQGTAAADAIELLLASARGGTIAPAPAAAGSIELEMLGWLELPLDTARALVVTGFQDGRVPSARRDDPFLPDAARRKLGLPSADDRVARDVYAASALLASGREVSFVCARRNGQGDPLLPSRLLFHVPKEELLPRVDRALGRAIGRGQPEQESVPAIVVREPAYVLPRRTKLPLVESMRVTSFADYLRSPYGFYLKHVVRAEPVDDAAREMDGRSFGTLAHDVFKSFGASDAVASTDAKEIARALKDALETIALERFGKRPLPAVGLQVRQLARRLDAFAREQAKRASEGWRIVAVEWEPTQVVALELGHGERPMLLRGKVDRIESREARGSTRREFSILDYKTSKPEAARKRSGEWRDLQLPLYTRLAREVVGDEIPALGIFTVGKDAADTGVEIAGWDAAAIDDALDAARDVARKVRRGEFFDLGDTFPEDPLLLAIAGKGLVASLGAEAEENGPSAAEAST